MFNSITYWKLFGVILFFAFIDLVKPTQSVYSCPLGAFNTRVNLRSRYYEPRFGYPNGITDL